MDPGWGEGPDGYLSGMNATPYEGVIGSTLSFSSLVLRASETLALFSKSLQLIPKLAMKVSHRSQDMARPADKTEQPRLRRLQSPKNAPDVADAEARLMQQRIMSYSSISTMKRCSPNQFGYPFSLFERQYPSKIRRHKEHTRQIILTASANCSAETSLLRSMEM